MTTSPAKSRLLTVKETAEYLRCGVSTLNKLRVSGGGPMYVKMHGRVFYKLDTLDRYIARHELRSTAHEKTQAA
jgi:hypothetical protein